MKIKNNLKKSNIKIRTIWFLIILFISILYYISNFKAGAPGFEVKISSGFALAIHTAFTGAIILTLTIFWLLINFIFKNRVKANLVINRIYLLIITSIYFYSIYSSIVSLVIFPNSDVKSIFNSIFYFGIKYIFYFVPYLSICIFIFFKNYLNEQNEN